MSVQISVSTCDVLSEIAAGMVIRTSNSYYTERAKQIEEACDANEKRRKEVELWAYNDAQRLLIK